MSERTNNIYNLNYVDLDQTTGAFQMPVLHPIVYKPERLVGFDHFATAAPADGIHFYLDDYRFERLWKQPQRYIDVLKKFDCVLTPDFSLYTDMPLSMMIWNVYRSRLLGQMMQNSDLTVIPTVTWADPRTYDFCFDGLPKFSTLSISTIGVRRRRTALKIWQQGVDEVIRRLKPVQLLIYGDKIEYPFPEEIDVVYYQNDNIARLRGLADGK